MPRKSLLDRAAETLVTILPKLKDPQRCKPGELVKLLNSTPLGEVLKAATLRKHRERAGLRIGDGKTINLFRYAAWLAGEVQIEPPAEARAQPPEPMAEEGDVILHTRAETAAWFGVDERTVAKWLTVPDFPGKAGSPGKRNGYFPARAIEAWRDGRAAAGEEDDDLFGKNFEQAGLTRAKRQMAELDLAERVGQLVDAGEVSSRVTRLVAEAAAVLRQLPAELTAQVAELVEPDVLAQMRETAGRRVEQALARLAKAARLEADDAEEDEENEDDGATGKTLAGDSPTRKPAAQAVSRGKRKRPAKRRRGS